MTATYDIFQQVFALSQISNNLIRMEGKKEYLQLQMNSYVQHYLNYDSTPTPDITALLGEWSVVWGPVVFQAPTSNVSDNAMLVARSTATLPDGSTKDVCVVAIAGTAAMSNFDWNCEDGIGGKTGAAIEQVVSWTDFLATPSETVVSQPIAGQPYISLGTATGLYTLLVEMTDQNKTLADYLGTVSADILVVTGHSLGGALSAALGLYLAQNKVAPQIPITYVYATAGASPGNDVFAQIFTKTLPPQIGPSPSKSWNVDIWNTRDVVPQAWSIAPADPSIRTICNVNGIYNNDSTTPAPTQITTLSSNMYNWSKNSGVTYTPIEGSRFTAPFTYVIKDDDFSLPINVPPKQLSGFAAQALYQHSTAYSLEIFGEAPRLPAYSADPVQGVTKESICELYSYFKNLLGMTAPCDAQE
ncbi:lipase family protein [Methylobacterium tarhaniae]|uniref:lipase family protein n=1 Tax=Methylobacterium tarhaniae TaxID=1187852 RepID=UPI00069CE604|nr:hypothetical protein [Methylobacterium tarhaniae]